MNKYFLLGVTFFCWCLQGAQLDTSDFSLPQRKRSHYDGSLLREVQLRNKEAFIAPKPPIMGVTKIVWGDLCVVFRPGWEKELSGLAAKQVGNNDAFSHDVQYVFTALRKMFDDKIEYLSWLTDNGEASLGTKISEGRATFFQATDYLTLYETMMKIAHACVDDSVIDEILRMKEAYIHAAITNAVALSFDENYLDMFDNYSTLLVQGRWWRKTKVCALEFLKKIQKQAYDKMCSLRKSPTNLSPDDKEISLRQILFFINLYGQCRMEEESLIEDDEIEMLSQLYREFITTTENINNNSVMFPGAIEQLLVPCFEHILNFMTKKNKGNEKVPQRQKELAIYNSLYKTLLDKVKLANLFTEDKLKELEQRFTRLSVAE